MSDRSRAATAVLIGACGALLMGFMVSCTFPDVNIVAAGAPCVTDDDCGTSVDPCVMHRCVEKTCRDEARAVSLCPLIANPCEQSACVAASCTIVVAEAGTDCPDGVCVAGACVACETESDCLDDTAVCEAGYCVSLHCGDQMQNGGESGEDCGGLECPPCPAGGGCVTSADCGGIGCVDNPAGPPDKVCGDCANDADCVGAEFCCLVNEGCGPAGTCQPRLAVATACSADVQCATGNCVDGVCCEERCAEICEACAAVKTGVDNGQCAPVSRCGQDDECSDLSSCNGAGSCQLAVLVGCP